MTGEQLTERADRIAENAFLKLIGRVGMASAFPVMVAAMSWIGSTLWSFNSEQARLTGRIDVLTERINSSMADRYSGADATRDFRLRDQKDAEQDRRLDQISKDVQRLLDRK